MTAAAAALGAAESHPGPGPSPINDELVGLERAPLSFRRASADSEDRANKRAGATGSCCCRVGPDPTWFRLIFRLPDDERGSSTRRARFLCVWGKALPLIRAVFAPLPPSTMSTLGTEPCERRRRALIGVLTNTDAVYAKRKGVSGGLGVTMMQSKARASVWDEGGCFAIRLIPRRLLPLSTWCSSGYSRPSHGPSATARSRSEGGARPAERVQHAHARRAHREEPAFGPSLLRAVIESVRSCMSDPACVSLQTVALERGTVLQMGDL